MESDPENIKRIVRNYFLQNGRSMKRLHDILEANLLMHHLKKWSSLLLELFLYLFFVAIILILTLFPADIPVSKGMSISIKEVSNIVLFLKVGIIITSLPLVAFARTLRRSRLKNELIRDAFKEVEKMKESFDKVVRDLNL